MFKKFMYGIAGIGLLAVAVFFGSIIVYVARLTVWPAVLTGSLNVETNSMILNIVWEGNEIYILLLVYLLLAAGSAFGALRAFRAALPRR